MIKKEIILDPLKKEYQIIKLIIFKEINKCLNKILHLISHYKEVKQCINFDIYIIFHIINNKIIIELYFIS